MSPSAVFIADALTTATVRSAYSPGRQLASAFEGSPAVQFGSTVTLMNDQVGSNDLNDNVGPPITTDYGPNNRTVLDFGSARGGDFLTGGIGAFQLPFEIVFFNDGMYNAGVMLTLTQRQSRLEIVKNSISLFAGLPFGTVRRVDGQIISFLGTGR